MASLLQGVISEMNQIEGIISFGRVQDEIFMANGFAEGNNKIHRKRLEVFSHHVARYDGDIRTRITDSTWHGPLLASMVLERNTISNYLLRASRDCSLTIVRLVFIALIQVHHSLAYLKAQSMA